jgi:hypothetical protein
MRAKVSVTPSSSSTIRMVSRLGVAAEADIGVFYQTILKADGRLRGRA